MSTIFRYILEMGITAGFVVLGVCAVRLLCRKAPKWLFVALWGLVALRLLVPFSVESPISVIPSISIPVQEDRTPQTQRPAQEDLPSDEAADPVPPANDRETTTATAAPQMAPTTTVSFMQVASVVWLVGVAAMLGYATISYIGVWRRVRTATKEEAGVYRSEAVGSPFILGVICPHIYVPYDLDGERLEAVLAHERAHIQRLDHILKPLGFLLPSVYWFQPLLWTAYILLCRDIELACDERVVKTRDETQRQSYSLALVSAAVGRRRLASCPLAFGEVAVKERVKSVMNYKKPALWIVVAAVVLSVAAAVCLLTRAPACKEQKVGSFSGATLAFYCGEYTRRDTVSLDDDLEDMTASVAVFESGTYGFAVKEVDETDMTVTLQCNREVWRNGECVKTVIVPCDERVVLQLSETPTENAWTIQLELELYAEKDAEKWYLKGEASSTTMYRYVSGHTVLYLYDNYFVLLEEDTGITSLREPLGLYPSETGWMATSLSVKSFFPSVNMTQGRFEWQEDRLILTADGDLARYVFQADKEHGKLKHIKREMRRHKTSDAPILGNLMTFSCEYTVSAHRTSDIPKDITYTLSDITETHLFSGESGVNDLRITSLGNGRVFVTREDPGEDGYLEEHELIDLKQGKSLGVRGSAVSNHAALGRVGYAPTIIQADGKVFVTAYYISWCGTGNPPPILYELEGLSSLQNGTVNATVNEDELVLDYTDDNSERHVTVCLLDGENTAVTRPLVVTKNPTSSPANFTDQYGKLTYNQISAAYVRVDGSYKEIQAALADGSLTFASLETLMAQAVANGEAVRVEGRNGYSVNVAASNAYHRMRITKDAEGVYTVEVGYLVTDDAERPTVTLSDETMSLVGETGQYLFWTVKKDAM